MSLPTRLHLLLAFACSAPMECTPFAGLLFDSSALAWGRLRSDRFAGMPAVAYANALRVPEVSSEGCQTRDVVGVQTIAGEGPEGPRVSCKVGVADVLSFQGAKRRRIDVPGPVSLLGV